MTFGSLTDIDVRRTALGILSSGGVVILSTDTLPGFTTSVSSAAGLDRIARAKRVEDTRPYILLASSVEMIARYVSSFGCGDRTHLAAVWPAPLTAILPAGEQAPAWAGATIAFRVPDSAGLRDLIEELGEPVISTSVNIAGEVALKDAATIVDRFAELVDAVILETGAAGETASTIVDLTGPQPVVVRQGDYAWATRGDSKPSN